VLDVGSSTKLMALECGLKPVYLKALGGFLLMITDDGEVIYISENAEEYLGILQVSAVSLVKVFFEVFFLLNDTLITFV